MTQRYQDTIQQKLLLYTMHAEPHDNFCPNTVLTIEISVDGVQQWHQQYFDQEQDSAYRPAPLPRVPTNTEWTQTLHHYIDRNFSHPKPVPRVAPQHSSKGVTTISFTTTKHQSLLRCGNFIYIYIYIYISIQLLTLIHKYKHEMTAHDLQGCLRITILLLRSRPLPQEMLHIPSTQQRAHAHTVWAKTLSVGPSTLRRP